VLPVDWLTAGKATKLSSKVFDDAVHGVVRVMHDWKAGLLYGLINVEFGRPV